MSAAIQDTDWFVDLAKRGQREFGPVHIDWLNQARQSAQQALAHLARPERKQEAWRYTNIDPLLKTQFAPAANDLASANTGHLDWVLDDTDSYRLVFINGRLHPHFSNTEMLERGVKLGSLHAMLTTDPEFVGGWFGQAGVAPANVFSTLNTALLNDGLLVHVPRGVELDKPIEVIYSTLEHEQPLASHLRNLVVLEAGAKATVIERFVSPGDFSFFNNIVSEVVVEEGARLEHYRVQEESRRTFHVAQLTVRQARDSHYKNVNLAMGGTLARTDLNVLFAGEGAQTELDGLYVVGDQQQIDNHLDIVHRVPHGASRENYKGILLGKGRAVFDGRIVVERDAQQTNAHLSNKNLMLTRDAEVDTKPQLEIYADNVKCSHGTTVGQIDPNQLFYLRSRGIDRVQAQKMLCLGFAGEILEQIDIEALRTHVSDKLSTRLEQAVKVA